MGILSSIGGFLFSGVGKIAMAVLIGMALIMYIRFDAKRDAFATCQYDAMRAELTAVKRQQAASERVAASAIERAQNSEIANIEMREQINDYEAQLADLPGCKLTGDDVKRLREIR